ncbi:MAG: hypothetical protein QOI63_1410 [Thermoplasmata archaeon]|jgi:hypothetical protein|nr:hypothetical protein [Thermoplasmata archaeon]
MDADPPAPDGWARPALRNVALMVLVMGGLVAGGVGAMASWAAGHPAYPEAVLAPAQERLTLDRAAIERAQAAALRGEYAQAKAILEQVRQGQADFVRDVLAPAAPRAPELRQVHAALLELYATLGDGLDSAILCFDGLAAGPGALLSPACAQGQAALALAPQQAQAIADRIAALEQELAS